MRYLRYALYAVCLTFAICAYPSNPAPAKFTKSNHGLTCAPIKEMTTFIIRDLELGFAATFVENNGYVMSLFFSHRTGYWIITGNLDDGTACIVTRGWGFWPVLERKA